MSDNSKWQFLCHFKFKKEKEASLLLLVVPAIDPPLRDSAMLEDRTMKYSCITIDFISQRRQIALFRLPTWRMSQGSIAEKKTSNTNAPAVRATGKHLSRDNLRTRYLDKLCNKEANCINIARCLVSHLRRIKPLYQTPLIFGQSTIL